MRSERLATSSPELDAAEGEWWDRFSSVSERLWAMDPPMSKALRSGYLDRAVAHFAGAAGSGRVLDLGCGSGVISRHFASAGIPVLGVDVSGEQIEQARRLASGHPSEALMEFRVGDTAELWSAGERFDGVVAHAFLHHLASDELESTIASTRSLLGAGGRAWFYEPVFYRPGKLSPSALAGGVVRRAIATFSRVARSRRSSDHALLERLDAFQREATEKGYFLSPKEVPFTPDELIEVLSAHLEVLRLRWENTASYQLASELSLSTSADPRPTAERAVRLAASADAAFGESGELDRYRGLGGYGFASAFCQVRDD